MSTIIHDLRCTVCEALHFDRGVVDGVLPRCDLCQGQTKVSWEGGKPPGTDVYGHPIVVLFLPGHDSDDFSVHPDSHGHFPFPFAKGVRQTLQGEVVDVEVLKAVFYLELCGDPLQIGGRFLDRGLFHLDAVELDRWIPFNLDVTSRLADDLFSGPGFLGHEN